jgi:dTMP kinase
MNTGRGVFLAIEGSDGSGKGTQFKKLSERLIAEGYDVATFDFPQYEQPSSYFVREYLNGKYGSANDVGPYTSSLFYALDRFEAAPRIREALAQGKVVLSNRFVGSNMAHQGTKFQHAEERRGFFIWLDNLEFEMLRIPRPTTSFVLRVPAEIAQQLVGQKDKRIYTDKTHDVHEADINHLKKAETVYDDLCQLFPKDFARIDCTRGDTLLGVDVIHDILWQKIEPMLPAKRRKKKSAPTEVSLPVPVLSAPAPSKAPDEPPASAPSKPPLPTAHLEGMHLALRDVSILTAKKLERGRLASYVELPSHLIAYDQKDGNGDYRYYVPHYFEPALQEKYRAHLDQIFNLYGEMVRSLCEYLEKESGVPQNDRDENWRSGIRLQALDAVRGVLPAAATTTVGVYGSALALESLVHNLLSDPLPEAYETAKALLIEARHHAPAFMEGTDLAGDVSYRTTAAKKLSTLARQHLPVQYANPSTGVHLADVWPRNEFDLLPDMLYPHSNLSVADLREAVAAWSYSQKIDVFDAYIGDRAHRNQRPGRALEKAHYSWDLVCDFDTFRDLQRHRMVDGLEWQELTPRYGYAMPSVIEQADLVDQYESCFDLSLRLHSLLQEMGYTHESQYATLQGHKMRWKVTYNAREAFQLHEIRTSPHNKPEVRALVQAMHEKLSQVHPLLGEAMKFAASEG